MTVQGDGPWQAIPLHGLTGSVTVDLTQMSVSWEKPLPVEYGVLERTAWLRHEPEAMGIFTIEIIGPPGWQGVVEIYEKSPVWGTDAYYVDWWTLLAAAPPGTAASTPVLAGDIIYIRLHPFESGGAVDNAKLSWNLDPSYVAKFSGISQLAAVGVPAEPNKIVVDLVEYGGDGGLEVVEFTSIEQQVAGPLNFGGEGTLVASLAAWGRGVRQWQFHDHRHPQEFGDSHESSDHSLESYTLPLNPYEMNSPHAAREFKYAQGVREGVRRLRVFESPHMPANWEFTGVIYTKQHHDELLHWAKKDHPIQITDHMRRTFEVVIVEFVPQDRRHGRHPYLPSLNDDARWRMRYTMKTLILRRVS